MRLFGGFTVKMGKDANGNDYYHQVPVRYGDTNRVAAHILKLNSENKINTVPVISCYITELLPNAERRLQPTFQDRVQVFEKEYNEATGEYADNAVGESYTLERYSPIPYDLTLNVDIWTSNTEQKLQLLEQILLLFNPSVNLQSSNNPFDWTSLGVVELINITWSARSIPQGTDDIIDVASLIYQLPIYLTPPAKIKRQVLIHSILANVYADTNVNIDDLNFSPNRSDVRQWITFEDRHIRVNENNIELLNGDNSNIDKTGDGTTVLGWEDHFALHGGIKNGITEIRLKLGLDPVTEIADEVVLTVSLHPTNTNLLNYSVNNDTLPANTVPMINGVIDPQRSRPGVGSLPPAAAGQRYLITNDIVAFAGGPWGDAISASANDIIQFNGTNWVVSFDASAVNSTEYTTNANTMKKLFFTGEEWVVAIEGVFEQGCWRIVHQEIVVRAVGALIVSRKTKRALLQLRSETARHGLSWGLWGGKLVGKEGDLEGLKRELCEELGWPGVPDTVAISHIYTFTTKDKKFRHVSYLILCENEFHPSLNHESAGHCWVNLFCWPMPVHQNTAKMFASRAFRSAVESIVYEDNSTA